MISAKETAAQDKEEGVDKEERQEEEGCMVSWNCIGRLHLRPLCSKLRYTPPNRLFTNGTHDLEMRRGKDGDVHVGKDMRDS